MAQRSAPLAFFPAPDHPLGQPPEVLEDDQAEHGGQGPELADGQRADLLEGPDEPGDPRLVELAIAVGDQRQRHREDAGIADERRRDQLGQQLVIAGRQVATHFAERVGDDVEVVHEPFGIDAGQAAAVPQGDELGMDLDEDPLVLDEAVEERAVGASGRRQDTGRRQPGRVTLQTLQAQALGPNGAFAPGVDQDDLRRFGLGTRRHGELDGRRIHARDALLTRSAWADPVKGRFRKISGPALAATIGRDPASTVRSPRSSTG